MKITDSYRSLYEHEYRSPNESRRLYNFYDDVDSLSHGCFSKMVLYETFSIKRWIEFIYE